MNAIRIFKVGSRVEYRGTHYVNTGEKIEHIHFCHAGTIVKIGRSDARVRFDNDKENASINGRRKLADVAIKYKWLHLIPEAAA